jgi:hypothetical protein
VTEPLDRFRALAERYCTGVEDPRELDLDELQRLLAELFVAALQLQSPVGGDEYDVAIPTRDWEAVFAHLCDALPADRYYRAPARTLDEDALSSVGDLADDLADIWRELKEGLVACEHGHPDVAVPIWRSGFDEHWRAHLVDAFCALELLREES